MGLTVNSNLLEAAGCLTCRGRARPCGQPGQVFTPNLASEGWGCLLALLLPGCTIFIDV